MSGYWGSNALIVSVSPSYLIRIEKRLIEPFSRLQRLGLVPKFSEHIFSKFSKRDEKQILL
jgi:muramoyltetrapeptide carboxypeptidase LdcA involved in peptidoglycan recycling